MRRSMALALLVSLGALGCASEPLEFADWMIPVPEGTRIIEYAAVPLGERTEGIEFVFDLEVGGRQGDADQLFYNPGGVAVDSSGRMYVLDRGNYRVQVFDPSGEFVATWGRQGEGPGEFSQPAAIATAGASIAVLSGRTRLSVWRFGEGHLADHQLPPDVAFFSGTPGGSLIGTRFQALDLRQNPGERQIGIDLFTLEGHEISRLGEFPDPSGMTYADEGGVFRGLRGPRTRVSLGVGPDGRIYLAPGEAYQLAALSGEGSLEWALRVSGSPEPVTAAEKEEWLAPFRQQLTDIVRFEVDWPEGKPALARMQLDGHGHVYVYPYVLGATPASEVPVDVYSSDGTQVFSGLIVNRRWRAAYESFVYVLERSPVTEEMKVVRYRLVEPFE